MQDVKRVVLTGFSGSGKSTVALLLAAKLGWRPVDNDQDIEIETGLTIPEIFADPNKGETWFRELERKHLIAALARDRVIVATGGGAVTDEAVWSDDLLYRPGTLTITLDAHPNEMLRRMLQQAEQIGNDAERPMLAGDNPLARIESLKARRQEAYDRANITLPVDGVSADAVADEIVDLVRQPILAPRVTLNAQSGSTAIHIGPGAIDFAGQLIKEHYPKAKRAWIVTDETVGRLYGKDLETTLLAFGVAASRKSVPDGEGSKSLAVASDLYDWMLGSGIERTDVVVALGGGMIGDLAGFIAATTLRGVGFVQLPTSLQAMVDASVGGKTGINHAAGKNLIGAFYQPPLVVIDTRFLGTLPHRELRSGFAEVIKHALIQVSTPDGDRGDLVRFLERNAHALRNLAEPVATYAVARNVALKAAVVENDEREAGIRAFLNFGHTLGHAIEASGYRYLHGEAIAVGLRAAMRIGLTMGSTNEAAVRHADALLDQYGLPKRAEVNPEQVMSLIGSDKKRSSGRQRWVLPIVNGGVTIRDDVPLEVVRQALDEVITPIQATDR
jgi:shikimate kinase/3-dehydroquinate synthase